MAASKDSLVNLGCKEIKLQNAAAGKMKWCSLPTNKMAVCTKLDSGVGARCALDNTSPPLNNSRPVPLLRQSARQLTETPVQTPSPTSTPPTLPSTGQRKKQKPYPALQIKLSSESGCTTILLTSLCSNINDTLDLLHMDRLSLPI